MKQSPTQSAVRTLSDCSPKNDQNLARFHIQSFKRTYNLKQVFNAVVCYVFRRHVLVHFDVEFENVKRIVADDRRLLAVLRPIDVSRAHLDASHHLRRLPVVKAERTIRAHRQQNTAVDAVGDDIRPDCV